MKQILEKFEELKIVLDLHDFVMNNCFVAGGAVRDLRRNKTPKDYDIFFKTEEAKEQFVQKFAGYCVETGLGNFNYNDFQFITINVGSPEKVIARFDWNVNQCYFDPTDKRKFSSYYVPEYLQFNCNSDYPLSAFLRLPYLIEKGFKIEPKEFAFVAAFIQNLGLLNSSEAATKALSFVPSSNGVTDLQNVPERAARAAIMKSPLAMAMREDQ